MPKDLESISRFILNHLDKFPNAGDTLEGIADWWLEYERVETAVHEIRQVLDLLVEKGILRVIKNKSGVNVYKNSE